MPWFPNLFQLALGVFLNFTIAKNEDILWIESSKIGYEARDRMLKKNILTVSYSQVDPSLTQSDTIATLCMKKKKV